LEGIISIANIAKIANIANIDWGGGNSEGCFEFLRDPLFNGGNVGNLGPPPLAASISGGKLWRDLAVAPSDPPARRRTMLAM
jgi:hypothetical protein